MFSTKCNSLNARALVGKKHEKVIGFSIFGSVNLMVTSMIFSLIPSYLGTSKLKGRPRLRKAGDQTNIFIVPFVLVRLFCNLQVYIKDWGREGI